MWNILQSFEICVSEPKQEKVLSSSQIDNQICIVGPFAWWYSQISSYHSLF